MDEEPENDSNDSQTIEVEIPIGTDVTETLRDHVGGNAGYNRSRVMSYEEEKERRASIKAILADETITPQERRRSIQSLMDGRRSSVGTATSMSSEPSNSADIYGYGDGSPDGYGGGRSNKYNILYPDGTPENTAICVPISNEKTKRAERTRPPCNHYNRNCTLIAPCCGASFGCRICHDDSPILPPLLIAKQASRRPTRSSSMPAGWTSMDEEIHTQHDTHHTIDRFRVAEIICRICYTKQSSKTYVGHGLPSRNATKYDVSIIILVLHLFRCCLQSFAPLFPSDLFESCSETSALTRLVEFNSGNTTAVYVTCGWGMMNDLIIVQTVVFVELVGQKISSTAMIVGCVSIEHYTIIIIAKVGSTSQIVRFARSFSLARGAPLTRCPAVMRFIGSVSDS